MEYDEGNEARPRAADHFAAIKAQLEELRRERAEAARVVMRLSQRMRQVAIRGAGASSRRVSRI